MSFLKPVCGGEADEMVALIYEKDIERMGYLPNYTRTFSLHPDAYQAWRGLIYSIAKPMDERRYELATIVYPPIREGLDPRLRALVEQRT